MRCAICGTPVPDRDLVWASGTAICHPCHARRQKTHSRMLVVMLLVFLPLFAAAAGFIGWVFLSIPRR